MQKAGAKAMIRALRTIQAESDGRTSALYTCWEPLDAAQFPHTDRMLFPDGLYGLISPELIADIEKREAAEWVCYQVLEEHFPETRFGRKQSGQAWVHFQGWA